MRTGTAISLDAAAFQRQLADPLPREGRATLFFSHLQKILTLTIPSQAVYAPSAHGSGALRAISEGKLKQKMESCGVAVLAFLSPRPLDTPILCWSGIALLWVASYFAYKSLEHKLKHAA